MLVAVVLGVGLMVWMSTMRDAITSELSDLGGAVQDINQSFVVYGVAGHSAATAGMDFLDQTDHCDDADDVAGQADNCIVFDNVTLDEIAAVSNVGQVVLFSFDGDASDSSPGANNSGTLLNGATIVNGELILDGIDDIVTIPNSSDINLGTHDERTIHIEFTPNDVNTKQVLYEEGGSARGLNIFIEGGLLYIGGYNNGQTNWIPPTFITTPIVAGQPLSATLVLAGGAGLQPNAFSGYLNGALIGNGVGSEIYSHAGGIGIGGINGRTVLHTGVAGPGGCNFNGSISEIQIYNRALSNTEVGSL